MREKEELVSVCPYCGEESTLMAGNGGIVLHKCAQGQEALAKEYLELLEGEPTTALEYAQRVIRRVELLQQMVSLKDDSGKAVAGVIGAQVRLDKLKGGLLKLAQLVVEEHQRG